MIALDKTPFYAQSGGQVGDSGIISTATAVFEVADTVKNAEGVFLHKGVVKKGAINVGDKASAQVNKERRLNIMRNHTAAHLLQYALREVLGTHVEQAGQLVDENRLRFDFTHFSAVTPEELIKAEKIMNDIILSCVPVTMEEMPIEQAKKKGAMALFGEKYGDTVRVVTADKSVELCGGTHVSNTGMLGLVHIVSEGSVASGVRRIEAVTGTNVMEYIMAQKMIISKACEVFKAGNPNELVGKVEQVVSELRDKEHQVEQLQAKIAAQRANALLDNAKEICGIKVVAAAFTGMSPDSLRKLCDEIKANSPLMVAVVAGINEDKGTVTFCACCGKDAVKKGAHAGNLVREVAKIAGGNGGGRPDSAMAGGKDLTKVDDALLIVDDVLEKQLNK